MKYAKGYQVEHSFKTSDGKGNTRSTNLTKKEMIRFITSKLEFMKVADVEEVYLFLIYSDKLKDISK